MKLIDGTTCSNCYGVFARSACGGYEIGVRPLVHTGDSMSFLGFRVRAVPMNTGNNVEVLHKADVAKGIVAAFPGVTFMKADNIRASFVGGVQFGIGMENVGALKEIFQSTRFASKLMGNLQQMIQDANGVLVDEEEIYDWIVNTFMSEMGEVEVTQAVELEVDPANVVVPLFNTKTVDALPAPEDNS